jgi:hypothetical protein
LALLAVPFCQQPFGSFGGSAVQQTVRVGATGQDGGAVSHVLRHSSVCVIVCVIQKPLENRPKTSVMTQMTQMTQIYILGEEDKEREERRGTGQEVRGHIPLARQIVNKRSPVYITPPVCLQNPA